MAALPDTAFWRVFDGPMKGVLDWARYDAFMERFGASEGEWFVFDLEDAVPAAPVSGEDFSSALTEANALIRAVKNRPWLGAIYADDLETPTYIKVFDPALLGGSCSMPGSKMLPRWIISRMKPDPLKMPTPEAAAPEGLLSRLAKGLTGGNP